MSIFIKNVAKNVTKTDIMNLYSKHLDTILDVRVKNNKAKPPYFWKYAFVDVRAEDLKKALTVPTHSIGERSVASITKYRGYIKDTDSDEPGVVFDQATMHTDEDSLPNSILVTEVTNELSIGQLRNYFSRYGKIVDIHISCIKPHQKKEEVIIKFEDKNDCLSCCRRVDHAITGKYVFVRSLDPNSSEQQVMWFDKAIGRLNFVFGNNTRRKSKELFQMMLAASQMENVSELELEEDYHPDERDEEKRCALVFRADVCDLDSDTSDIEELNPTLDVFPQEIREAMRRYREDREERAQRSTDSGVLCSPDRESHGDTDSDAPQHPETIDHDDLRQPAITSRSVRDELSRNGEPQTGSCGYLSSLSPSSPLGLPGRGRRRMDSSFSSTGHADVEDSTMINLGRKFASFGRGFRRVS